MKSSDANPEAALGVRSRWLMICQLTGLLLMIGVTRNLWFPSSALGPIDGIEFPAVPVFGFLVAAASGWSFLLSALACLFTVAAVVSLFNANNKKLSACLVTLANLFLIGTILLDQHRFFPWAWQSILLMTVWSMLPAKSFFRFARVLVVTIYIYSAVAKFDYQFVKTTGREILATLCSFVQFDSTNLTELSTDLLVIGFPLVELLIGIGLLLSLTRLVSMFVGIGMHLSLILVLGPFGMQNAGSVLIWNLMFAIQLLILYWPARRRNSSGNEDKQEPDHSNESAGFWVAAAVVIFLPSLEKSNHVDHWPSWGLYSPQASRCRLKIPNWKIRNAPEELQAYFRGREDDITSMREFDLAGWSIGQLNAPIYPQDRFQFGVAWYLVKQLKAERAFAIEVYSASHWWTGRRKVRVITDIKELENLEKKFWVNCRPSRL